MFKTGRRPRIYDPRVPHFSALKGLAKPIAVPEKRNYAEGMTNIGTMLNSILSCCTVSGIGHSIQVWSHHTNKINGMITEPDSCILQMYEESCGYNPNALPDDSGYNPTDQGGTEQSVLTYYLTKGFPTGPQGKTRHKLRSFVEIDTTQDSDIKRGIYECGLVYIGFKVPQHIMADPMPKVWDYDPKSEIIGGHCVILPGFDKYGYPVISWDELDIYMTNDFKKYYVDEVYALCDIDWLLATGKTLLGLSMAQLIEQVKYLRK